MLVERAQLYHKTTGGPPKGLPQKSLWRADQEVVDFFYWGNTAGTYRGLSEEQRQELDALRRALAQPYEGLEAYEDTGCLMGPAGESHRPNKASLATSFRLGYWASPYGDKGIQGVLWEYTGRDLSWAFGRGVDEYWVTPDWAASKARLQEIIKDIQGLRESCGDQRAVRIYADDKIPPVQTLGDAVRAVSLGGAACGGDNPLLPSATGNPENHEAVNTHRHNLLFRLPPPPLSPSGTPLPPAPRAIVFPATGPHAMGWESLMIVGEDPGFWDWVEEGLRTVMATIDFVLNQPDPENWLWAWED